MKNTSVVVRGANKARAWLKNNDYPYSDEIPLLCSNKQLSDGGHYGIEIPVVTSLKALTMVINALKAFDINHAILGETIGIYFLSDAEIRDMIAVCADEGFGLFFSPSPRPEYDRKAVFFRSDFGLEQGRCLNNIDAIACVVEEVYKLTEAGCRGIIVYDIGVLKLLNEMRSKGEIPKDTVFTTSSHCIVSNPLTAKVYADLGADHLVVLHDVGLSVLQEMRRMLPNDVLLSLPIDVYKSKGGFIRYHEIPEIVQIASPILLKLGASAQHHPYDNITEDTIKRRIERVILGLDYLNRAKLNLTPITACSPLSVVPRPQKQLSTDPYKI